MEKQFKEDQFTGKLIKEAGLDSPSLNFTSSVMMAINEKREVHQYKPLISTTGWFIFGGMLVIAVFGLFYTQPGIFTIPDKLNFSWAFPKIELSNTMKIGISCLLLFLLQIPFLKNLLERENYK